MEYIWFGLVFLATERKVQFGRLFWCFCHFICIANFVTAFLQTVRLHTRLPIVWKHSLKCLQNLSRLSSTSHGYTSVHMLISLLTIFFRCLSTSWEREKKNLWISYEVLQSICHPSKPCAGIVHTSQTLLSQYIFWFMHWSTLVIELLGLQLHIRQMSLKKMTDLCVWCKSVKENETAERERKYLNSKFLFTTSV